MSRAATFKVARQVQASAAQICKALETLRGLGPSVEARIGYEIDNLWNGTEQAWYPIAGHELRAPLTWSALPG